MTTTEQAGPLLLVSSRTGFFHGRYATLEELEADDAKHHWRPDYDTVEAVPADRWGERERRFYMNTAAQCFRHDHPHQIYPKEDRTLTRDNCAACALEGWDGELERFRKHPEGPNYAGWHRVYVEAGRVIPYVWRFAFLTCLEQYENEPYRACLELSVRTFGAHLARRDGGIVETIHELAEAER